MGLLKSFVFGLWFTLGFILLVAFLNIINPGKILDSTFTTIGIMTIFAVLQTDSLLNFGSVDA